MSDYDINSPLGRYRMAQQNDGQGSQRPVYMVDDEQGTDGGHQRQQTPQQPPQRRRARRRAALSAEEVEQFAQNTWSDIPQSQHGPPIAGPQINYSPSQGQGPYANPYANYDRAPSFEEIEQMHQEARSAIDRVAPEAKRRIEIITGLGRISDDLEVDGTKFTFQSIKTNERKDVYKSLFSGEDETKLSLSYKNRVEILARALTHIDDQPVDLVLGSDDLELRLYVFGELDDHITDYMYQWYRKNIEEVGEGKYSLTPEEVQELGEQLKKS